MIVPGGIQQPLNLGALNGARLSRRLARARARGSRGSRGTAACQQPRHKQGNRRCLHFNNSLLTSIAFRKVATDCSVSTFTYSRPASGTWRGLTGATSVRRTLKPVCLAYSAWASWVSSQLTNNFAAFGCGARLINPTAPEPALSPAAALSVSLIGWT